MKKFKFPLEGYLKIKKIEEDRKMADLAHVIGKIEKEKDQINHYFQNMEYYLEKKPSEKNINLHDTILMYEYLNQLSKKKRIAEKNINSFQDELKEKQIKANEARKNRRVIEILKEKKLNEYKYEMYKNENKELDEFNNRIKKKYKKKAEIEK